MAVREIQKAASLEEWFPMVSGRKHCVWLDGRCAARQAEWSVLGWDPVEVRCGSESSLLDWMDEVASWTGEEQAGVPFAGGLIGHFDYPEEVESYPPARKLSLSGWLGLYDKALLEHLPSGRIFAMVGSWLTNGEEEMEQWLDELKTLQPRQPCGKQFRTTEVISDGSREEYEQGVRLVREWIASGDVYQANLAQRFSCDVTEGEAPDLFMELRQANPAPYSAYLDCGDRKILSTSPELFLRVGAGGQIETRPIKGTRPRSSNPVTDGELACSLRRDRKEQAELLMIVDMERNDLGRISKVGTVEAVRDFSVETFASVHHLVGDVRGTLRPEVQWSDVFAATFPGGSITGAPKRRAMEIIRETERSSRGAFCGAIGYVSAGGEGCWNIAIRTLEWSGKRIQFGVGSGIVWDSDPAAEYRETLHKARRLFVALGRPLKEEDLIL